MPTGALLGGIIRWGLTILITFLLTQNVIDKETAGAATSNVPVIAGAIVGLSIPLVWSLYQKLKARYEINVALALHPESATREAVDDVVHTAPYKEIISTEPKNLPPNI